MYFEEIWLYQDVIMTNSTYLMDWEYSCSCDIYFVKYLGLKNNDSSWGIVEGRNYLWFCNP